MPARVCGMASALHAHFSDTLLDTGGFNPLLLSRCVRCAVKQRCWRISRNAILQGGKSGATGGQREGSMRTVKTFYLHGRWVGALSRSRRVASRTREGRGNKWPGEESARPRGDKRDYGPAAAAHQDRAGLSRRRAPTSFISGVRSVASEVWSCCCLFHSCSARRCHLKRVSRTSHLRDRRMCYSSCSWHL